MMQDKSPTQTDIFVAGQNGYHTYRIPAITATTKGTLLAFCEGRTNSSSDTDDIDIVLRRSFDGGATWQAQQLVADMGGDTIGNPCPVVDSAGGTIWLGLTWNALDGPESKIVLGQARRTVWLTTSSDDGATWAPLQEITKDVMLPDWRWYATGPGHGIQLQNGRLVWPCDFTRGDPNTEHTHFGSHIVFSDDHGASWRIGGTIQGKVNECEVAQLDDGRLYLNMRAYFGRNRRAVAWSSDNGATWSQLTLDETLVEPVCQASVVNIAGRGLLFANPASVKREKMTVRLSTDGGSSWAAARLLHAGPSAYSDLVALPDGRAACLYERGDRSPYEKITFTGFDLQWLAEGA